MTINDLIQSLEATVKLQGDDATLKITTLIDILEEFKTK